MSKNISLENLKKYDEKIKIHIGEKISQEHLNKSVLEKFSEDETGNLLYNGKKISGNIEYGNGGFVTNNYVKTDW